MRHPAIVVGALVGGLLSLPFLALDYLGQQWGGLPFVPYDVFDALARVLPGRLITIGIDVIVRTVTVLGLGPIDRAAKGVEQLLGVAVVVAGAAVFGAGMALALHRTTWRGEYLGAAVGAGAWLIVAALDIELRAPIVVPPATALVWLLFVIAGWGISLGALLDSAPLARAPGGHGETSQQERRSFLVKLAGGALAVALTGWGLARFPGGATHSTGASRRLSRLRGEAPGPGGQSAAAHAAEPSTPNAGAMREQVPPAPGTRPEVTANADFYRIDIDTLPPRIEQDSWALEVSGLFERARRLTLADLMAFPAVTQPITLSCISNPIGGDLISTSYWTGARLRVVLQRLGIRPEARGVLLKAADGFYESVTLDDMLDPRTLLVYGMGGETLPVEHGFPLRIYIPNRYGMKQPKWIISMEAMEHPGSGYWVDRGWSAEARPRIVSMIDTVAKTHIANGKVPIGGIAWAGDRGIQRVELQVDSGPWSEAILRTPPLGPLTWVEWRYDWPVAAGRHVFRVRATDGTGALQSGTPRGAYPDGATGYHAVTISL